MQMLAEKSINSPARGSILFSAMKKNVLRDLSHLVHKLMADVDGKLFELSKNCNNDQERNHYFDAMREFRTKQDLLQLNFDSGIEAGFNRLMQHQSIPEPTLELEELSLVRLDDMNDSITMDNMISRSRSSFDDELYAVIERMKAVLHLERIDPDVNPIDPKVICNSFHLASEMLEIDTRVKLVFYQFFDSYVIQKLGEFYHQINLFFIEKGVLADFKVSADRLKNTTRFRANRITAKASRDSTHPLLGGLPEHAPESRKTQEGGELLGVLQQMLMGTSAQAIAATNADNAGILPAVQNSAYMSGLTHLQHHNLQEVSHKDQNPENFKQIIRQQLATFNQESQHQITTADRQLVDIISIIFDFFLDDENLPDPVKVLIGRLQVPILKAAFIDNSFFNQKKNPARQLLDKISKSSLGWSHDSKREQVLIDKIDSVVHFILSEFDDSLDVFDQALEDFNSFLAVENEKRLKIDATVSKQEQDQEQKISAAQDAAAELIEAICNNHELSFEVRDFLETVWSSVLFHSYLSLGASSNHWKNLRRISSTLIWTLVPKSSEDERLKILKTLPSLLRALSKGMELVQIGRDTRNRIFYMLAQEHTKVVKKTSRNIAQRFEDDAVWPTDSSIANAFSDFDIEGSEITEEIEVLDTDATAAVETTPELKPTATIAESQYADMLKDLDSFTAGVSNGEIEIDEEIIMDTNKQPDANVYGTAPDQYLRQSQELEVGDWVRFEETSSQPINTRLSWKSNVTGKLVFVNRHGVKIKNMSINGLAIELRAGRAAMIQSSSAFDRAINTILPPVKR